jgi:fumarate reductase flavoprotein subunit
MSAQVERVTSFTAPVHTKVAIVGGGACGLTAALTLSQLGMDCVVLERDVLPTGSTALSSGFIPAAATQTQHAQGISDSTELFAQDIQTKAHGRASPILVQAYSQAIGPAIDSLAQHHGVPWHVLDTFLYPGHSVHRMHAVPEKTGAALMMRLHNAAEAAGVVVLTEAHVQTLYVNASDQILGLGFLRPDGQLEQLSCDSVLLACNGFGGNSELVKSLLPDMRDALYAGHIGNDGNAIQWGQQLGARLADLGGYQGHGSWAVPQGALISWALMMEGAVQINAQGLRFHDETQGYSEAAVHVLAQPKSTAWNVFDDQLLAFAQDFPDFCEAQAAGAVHSLADVDALAKHIGCATDTLSQTINAVHEGLDPQTGRRFKRSLKAPFHAIRVTGALFHTQGGLDINAQCQVLRADGTCLPNLLAAGGAARGVSGDAVWGYLSGNGLLSAIAGGYLAAHTAAYL